MAISQVKPLLLLLLISLFALPALGLINLQNCSNPNKYSVRVKTVKISPEPLKLKHNANLSITAFTSKKIPNRATVVVYELDQTIETVTRRHSLCKVTACPVTRGRFVLNFSNILVKKPMIREQHFYFTVYIHMKDVEEELMCIFFGTKSEKK